MTDSPPRPWRKYPGGGGSVPDVRDYLAHDLQRKAVEGAIAVARPELTRELLSALKTREENRRRVPPGFRLGHWPKDRILLEVQRDCSEYRDVAACLGVMLLEADATVEHVLAAAVEEAAALPAPSETHLAEILARRGGNTRSHELLYRVAWAFRSYGGRLTTTTHSAARQPTVATTEPRKPLDLARHLEEVHNELQTATKSLRTLVGALEEAREVRRLDAEAALDGALKAVGHVRDDLASAALLSPESVSNNEEPPTSLAVVVARVATALRELAAPSGLARLQLLAAELAAGEVVAAMPARGKALERARVAATQEARDGISRPDDNVASFPGPTDESSWLSWFWELARTDVESTTRVTDALELRWQRILDFLLLLQEAEWRVRREIAAAPEAPSAPASNEAPRKTDKPDDAAKTSSQDHGDAASTSTPPKNRVDEAVTPSSLKERTDSPSLAPDATATPFARVLPPVLEPAPPIVAAPASGPVARTLDTASDVRVPQVRIAASPRIALHVPSLSQFKDTHWVDSHGAVVPGPWNEADFDSKLATALIQALLLSDWALARLYNRALSQRGAVEAIAEFELALDLRAGRWPPTEDAQEKLVSELRALSESGANTAPTNMRVRLALALAAPAALALLTDEEVEQFALAASCSERFGSFLSAWANVARRTAEPFEHLARQLAAERSPSVDDLKSAELEACADLKQKLKELHSGAGGRVQRTHCRAAWDEFLSEARPFLFTAAATPRDQSTRIEIGRLARKAKKIFDRGEAKLQDRTVMDRAVETLVDAAQLAFHAADRVDAATKVATEGVTFPAAVTQLVVAAPEPSLTSDERWLLQLYVARLHGHAGAPSRVLHKDQVEHFPWILASWPVEAEPIRAADVDQCLDPLSVAAHLLTTEPLTRDADDLRSWALSIAPRILPYFANLKERERGVIEDQQRRERDEIDAFLSRLRRSYVDLAELADPDAARVLQLTKTLEHEAASSKHDPALLTGWGAHVQTEIDRHVEDTLARVAAEAAAAGIAAEQVAGLVSHRRYADLHALAGRASHGEVPRIRATLFRTEAERQWPEPRAALAADRETQVQSTRNLVHDWSHYSKFSATPLGADKQLKLREQFVEFVFEQTEQRRKTKIPSTKVAHRVSCTDIASWLGSEAQAPTFLPQLHRYAELVIKTLPLAATDRSLPAKVAAMGEQGSITVLLAPGLSAANREGVRQRLRETPGRPVAILDDLDLCRLLNPNGPQPPSIEALLEVVIEQQRWDEFAPYEVQEGQHVRMEMYVGRRTEAERLVGGTTYSRIFSGRRLGKTALLRYVEHEHDRKLLPSGNKLRVLYVPIVGRGAESEVVNDIIDRLGTLTGIVPSAVGTPKERLKLAVSKILDARPSESYLIFLDEADTFFENQTRREEGASADDETSLSWAMRDLESNKDNKSQPRIRFVVCGYRATNRSEGAWGNWGDVLLLNPLDPADAVQLVIGPLARLGIDARQQADAIAFRCGYQPAVIIHFCARLLDDLERRTPFTSREGRVVTADDVVAVYQLPEVQERVRDTCWLNFVGDPEGQLTFAAFLAECAEFPPGTPIDDAPQRLLKHISLDTPGEMDDFSDGTWQDIASRHLRDLVKRSLLWEAQHHPLSLRLRFPHQLPILLQESPKSRIRDARTRLRAQHVERKERKRAGWLVPDDVLENVRWCISNDGRDLGVRCVVIASHWVTPLLSRSGLQHRLPEQQLVNRRAQASDIDTSDETAQVLVGGADLLRAALEHQRHSQGIEIARLGRLSSEAVESFFKRTRGVEFSSTGALEQIMAATGGVPLVLARLHDQFPEGATVDAKQLADALVSLRGGFPILTRELMKGPEETRLVDRELDLLRIVLAVNDLAVAPDELAEVLTDAELLKAVLSDSDRDVAHLEPICPGDNERLELLLTLGVLPRRTTPGAVSRAAGELAPVAADDVIHQLVRNIARPVRDS